ncbi:MAG TPA: tetratricopeptide repeat protein, partial [Bacteroidota bacterium]|nr:tetratricopeptide repeat protein [Bacteroidota bacterium]
MAVARLVCGDCGGALSPLDVRCPSCGASIERVSPEAAAAPPVSSGVEATGAAPLPPVACGSCGQANRGDAEFCSSCGARLASAAPLRRPRGKKRDMQPPAARKDGAPRRFDPWQIISVVAILALLGYGAYLLIDHEESSSSSSSSPPEGGSPVAEIRAQSVDLSPLEEAVKANPADAGARLKLANALEDTKQYDRAIAEYRDYLKLKPKDPDARTDLGICYFQEGLADSSNGGTLLHDAAAEMEQAFTTAPRPHQPSAFNLGIVYLHLNRMDEADRWFRKVVSIDAGSELGKRAENMLSQHPIP